MTRYDTTTLSEYLTRLSAREPVPGGGSAAALTGALGAALIQMVAKYSMGKGKPGAVERKLALLDRKAEGLRAFLLEMVSKDAESYLAVVAARKVDKAAQKTAARAAAQVPRQIKKACESLKKLVPYLRSEGNKYLLSDVDAAQVFLDAAIKTSDVMIKANS